MGEIPSWLPCAEVVKENLTLAQDLFARIFPKEVEGWDFTDDCFVHSLSDRDLAYWIYFLDEWKETPVGISGLYVERVAPGSAWLGWFGVLPEYRRRGIGDAIIRRHEQLVFDKGFNHSRLYTDADNETAIRFYKKHRYTGEEYAGEVPKEVSKSGKILIFSKVLEGGCPLVPWNNLHLDF